MPRIYVPLSIEGFELCHPERQEDFETFNAQIDGTPRRKTWQPIPVHLVHEDEGKKLAASDSPWLGSNALIFRRSALEKLEPLLQDYGELLPLKCSEGELFVFNATRVVDALDQEASSLVRFSNGRVMRVMRFVFRVAPISGVDVFKIPDLAVSPTFVSDRIVQAWYSTGLRGLEFKEVWSG